MKIAAVFDQWARAARLAGAGIHEGGKVTAEQRTHIRPHRTLPAHREHHVGGRREAVEERLRERPRQPGEERGVVEAAAEVLLQRCVLVVL